MLFRGAHVIDDNIVVGNLVALLSMIPKIPSIFNQLAVMVHQHVVNRNDAPRTIAGIRALLSNAKG